MSVDVPAESVYQVGQLLGAWTRSTDDDEFSAFVVEHESRLLRTAFLLTGDRGHAEDLLQTALTTAYRHWWRVRAADRPLPYVRKLMVNTHLSWRRRLTSTERVMEMLPERSGADPQAAHAVQDEVRRALATLDDSAPHLTSLDRRTP